MENNTKQIMMNNLIIALLAVVRIAAFNSSEEAKQSADIVCTGNHDEKTIQTVLDKYDGNTTETCTLIFADGTYHIDNFPDIEFEVSGEYKNGEKFVTSKYVILKTNLM